MPVDVDLLRDLLLRLEGLQESPRATVIIATDDEADLLSADKAMILEGLEILQSLDYIEGPGAESEGLWLFRKLTRKGTEFVKAARDTLAWERIKRAHQRRSPAS